MKNFDRQCPDTCFCDYGPQDAMSICPSHVVSLTQDPQCSQANLVLILSTHTRDKVVSPSSSDPGIQGLCCGSSNHYH